MAKADVAPFVDIACEGTPRRFVNVVEADLRPDGEKAIVLSICNPGEESAYPALSLCVRWDGEWWS